MVARQDEAELSSDDIAGAQPSKKRAKSGGNGGAARRKRSADDLDLDDAAGLEVGCAERGLVTMRHQPKAECSPSAGPDWACSRVLSLIEARRAALTMLLRDLDILQ